MKLQFLPTLSTWRRYYLDALGNWNVARFIKNPGKYAGSSLELEKDLWGVFVSNSIWSAWYHNQESVTCWTWYRVCSIKAQPLAEVSYKILSFYLHWSPYHLAILQKNMKNSLQICLDSRSFQEYVKITN